MTNAAEPFIRSLSLDDTYLMVAAIDFGTTFSGYAFSFKSDKDHIYMNKNWGAGAGFETYKVPTCVMTKPNGSFHSFGYEAENQYKHLNAEEHTIGGPNGYNLYRHFKMLLHKQGAKMRSTVTSTSGHVRKALDIFSMSLNYLKGHMLEAISKSVEMPPESSDIRWVLTVPAIWTDESKRFMREAAFQCGLITDVNSQQLLIALEPEAASVFCRKLDVKSLASKFEEKDNVKFKTGDKILVVDAGGGTVDITAHEVLFTGHVKEIAPPSGGAWGGTKVDQQFISMIYQIFGADLIDSFRTNYEQQWLDFLLLFEKAKKHTKFDGEDSIRIPLPFSFDSECQKIRSQGTDEVLKKCPNKNVSFNAGYLVIKLAGIVEIFREPIDKIIPSIDQIKSDTRLKGLNYILLVGGFAECILLQKACLKAFGQGIGVLIPIEAQLAVIKGAIYFGHNPLQIASRISKMTYGCGGMKSFDASVHDENKKILKYTGEVNAKDVFHVYLTRGEEVQTGSQISKKFYKTEKNQTIMDFPIYKTMKKSPIHTDDDEVEHLGKVEIKSSAALNEVEVRFSFGHTEILVEARETSKGTDFPVNITIDFLSD